VRVYRAIARTAAGHGSVTAGERAILAAVARALGLGSRTVARVEREFLLPSA